MTPTVALGFDFKLLVVEILTLKVVTVSYNNFINLIGIKNCRGYRKKINCIYIFEVMKHDTRAVTLQ